MLPKRLINTSFQNNYVWLFSLVTRISFCAHLGLLLLDKDLIFGSAGVYPLTAVEDYVSSFYFGFISALDSIFVYVGLALLATSFIPTIQRWVFLGLSIFSFLLSQRMGPLAHIGDFCYVYFFLALAALPTITKSNRLQFSGTFTFLPLFFLRASIYVITFSIMTNSSWGQGFGLQRLLNHTELHRFDLSALAGWPYLIVINYFLMGLLLFITAASFIPTRFIKIRYALITTNITLQLLAMTLFKIEWVGVIFIFLDLILLSDAKSENNDLKKDFPLASQLAVAAIALGFINIESRDDHYGKSIQTPLVHNWYMFAPPPPVTGTWTARAVTTSGITEDLNQEDLNKAVGFKSSFRNYKYFYNLRRLEFNQLTGNLSQSICDKEGLASVQLTYSARDFGRGRNIKTLFPVHACTRKSI